MKLYVFFLSFFLAFSPSLSYAFAPIAIVGSTAGRIAVQTGTGSVIKKVAPNSMSQLMKNALAMCKANVLAMATCAKILKDMEEEDVHIVNNTTNNNKIEVEVYRTTRGCVPYVRWKYQPFASWMAHGDYHYADFDSAISHIESTGSRYIGKGDVTLTNAKLKLEQLKQFFKGKVFEKSTDWVDFVHDVSGDDYYVSGSNYARISLNPQYRVLCGNNDDKNYLDDEEIAEYFRRHATDDDITNIYNYDYSQHKNITVNNRTEQGDTINNYKNDFDDDEKEKRVSERATEKIKKKDKDYDIDDINDENCDKNDKGEYDKCGKDRDKKDDDDEGEKKDDEEKDKKEDDEDDLISCKTSDFHKKICKFIDDMDEFLDDTEDTDTRLKKSDDDEKPVSTKISFGGGCPPNTVININYLGISKNIVLFDSVRFCEFLDDFVKPSVVVISSLWAVYILRGSNNV